MQIPVTVSQPQPLAGQPPTVVATMKPLSTMDTE